MYFFKTALTILFLALSSKFFSQQNAFDFDGIDDYATAPNASALITNSGQLSMTMWVYPTSTVTGYPNFEGFAGFRRCPIRCAKVIQRRMGVTISSTTKF